jgi:GNAT superfamily N-acetyltransferase
MEPTIRAARAEDCERIYQLICELAKYERLEHLVETTPLLIHEQLIEGGSIARCLVLEAGDDIVGYAIYFPTYSTFLGRPGIWLEDLYVTPDYRGQGFGKALLQAVALEAFEGGAGRLEWAVLDWNEPSIGFYRQMGAAIHEDWNICRVTGEELRNLAGALPRA